MESINEIKRIIRKKTESYKREIIGVWETKCLYNPIQNGRTFNCKFIIVQTREGQGCAYSNTIEYNTDYLLSLVDKDCIDYNFDDKALEVAYYDSLSKIIDYGFPKKKMILHGSSIEKLIKRSEIIVQEAERLIGRLDKKKVLNVGVVGNIIYQFLEKNCEVFGSDFDPAIIGSKLFDKTTIQHGKKTIDLIKKVDIAVVTGMTITTETLDEIINTCKQFNTKLIVFAETGANLGQYYVNHGVDCFLSESFPFYIFNGDSYIDIISRK